MKKPRTKLGMILRLHRVENNLTAQELSDEIKLTRGYLSRIETGEIAFPSVATLFRIANLKKLKPEAKIFVKDMMNNRKKMKENPKKYNNL